MASGWRTEKEFSLDSVIYLFLRFQGASHDRDHPDCPTAVSVFRLANHDFSTFIAGDGPLDMEQILKFSYVIGFLSNSLV